jgi:hypothetical protein
MPPRTRNDKKKEDEQRAAAAEARVEQERQQDQDEEELVMDDDSDGDDDSDVENAAAPPPNGAAADKKLSATQLRLMFQVVPFKVNGELPADWDKRYSCIICFKSKIRDLDPSAFDAAGLAPWRALPDVAKPTGQLAVKNAASISFGNARSHFKKVHAGLLLPAAADEWTATIKCADLLKPILTRMCIAAKPQQMVMKQHLSKKIDLPGGQLSVPLGLLPALHIVTTGESISNHASASAKAIRAAMGIQEMPGYADKGGISQKIAELGKVVRRQRMKQHFSSGSKVAVLVDKGFIHSSMLAWCVAEVDSRASMIYRITLVRDSDHYRVLGVVDARDSRVTGEALFSELMEIINELFADGVSVVSIVTDNGSNMLKLQSLAQEKLGIIGVPCACHGFNLAFTDLLAKDKQFGAASEKVREERNDATTRNPELHVPNFATTRWIGSGRVAQALIDKGVVTDPLLLREIKAFAATAEHFRLATDLMQRDDAYTTDLLAAITCIDALAYSRTDNILDDIVDKRIGTMMSMPLLIMTVCCPWSTASSSTTSRATPTPSPSSRRTSSRAWHRPR